MPLPIAISLPHAGLTVPDWLQSNCCLSEAEIIQDGDEGAAEIYDLADEVAAFVTTDIARAVVDLNRTEGDHRQDGIIKTHTCYDIPIWHRPLTAAEEERLLAEHHRPYHRRLSALAGRDDVWLAVDCHTMAAIAPPVAPDVGGQRPWVCLGDVHGKTLPPGWMDRLADCFRAEFGEENVAVNQPFAGGHITKSHGPEMPWLQLELSRRPFLSNEEKRLRVLAALSDFPPKREHSRMALS